jgi:hypothetical protein
MAYARQEALEAVAALPLVSDPMPHAEILRKIERPLGHAVFTPSPPVKSSQVVAHQQTFARRLLKSVDHVATSFRHEKHRPKEVWPNRNA